MGRMGSTPIGKAFLPDLSVARLEKLYKREKKNSRAKLRLLAAMLRKNGMTMGQIAENLHTPVGTIHAWLRRFLDGGLNKLRDEHRTGRPSKLNIEELKELRHDLLRGPKANGFNAPFWTTKIVQEHVKRKYGKEYRVRGMRNMLHRVGFSSKMPRACQREEGEQGGGRVIQKKAMTSSASTAGRGSRYSFWTRQPST